MPLMEHTMARITELEEILDYQFTDKENGRKALSTYRVYSSDAKNDRFAVLGDVIADAILCEIWVASDCSKGMWTQARGAVLNNDSLTALGFQLRLDNCVILNPGTLKVSERTMATTMEAIFAAVYLDGGVEALKAVMGNIGIMAKFKESLLM